MKHKNLQKTENNKACPAKLERSRGFVLLFVVLLSSIILAVTLSVASISFKEMSFSTEAKETGSAFFAADTGSECALYYDKSTVATFVVGSPLSGTIECAGSTISPSESPPSYNYWSFTVTKLGDGLKGCAKVTVDKSALPDIKITSKGYNNCVPSANTVERELQLNYQ